MWQLHQDFTTLDSVENNRPSTPPRAVPGFGPLPGAGRSRAPVQVSVSAAGDARAQTEPTTLAALVATSGLHANTVREHLDALVRDGLAHRHPEAPSGRGRPAWLYEATGVDAASAPEYAGLASALAAAIHRTSASPTDDAVTAGRVGPRARTRARCQAGGQCGRGPTRGGLLLDEVGFAPQADARSSTVRLTRCPLLEAAHKYPDIVCGVHLGLAQGHWRSTARTPTAPSCRSPSRAPAGCT